jgi:DNA repair exonuclease SbcCD nuclease subunit
MIRILHLADLHLGWTPRFLDPVAANMRREARDRLLDRAVAYACDPAHGIDLVVVAGDLFESHEPDSTLIGRATAALRRLPMPLVTTPGNHDEITYASSVYRRTPWPGVLVTTPGPSRVATLRIRDETVHLYSLAYTGGVTSVRPSIRSFPRGSEEGLHIAVFHGSLGPWGGDRSLPLDLDALRVAAYDYVALGHIHKHEVHRLGEALAVYPGMIEGKGFDDPGVGHFTIAEVERGASRVWTAPCETWPVRVCPLDVTGLRAEEVEEAILRQTDDRLSLRVTLTGARSFAIDP